jgi:hypothetical protein
MSPGLARAHGSSRRQSDRLVRAKSDEDARARLDTTFDRRAMISFKISLVPHFSTALPLDRHRGQGLSATTTQMSRPPGPICAWAVDKRLVEPVAADSCKPRWKSDACSDRGPLPRTSQNAAAARNVEGMTGLVPGSP